MTNLIGNEKKYIENILNDELYLVEEKPYTILYLLAQYLYDNEGLRKKKITEKLIDFLNIHYPDYPKQQKALDDICSKIAVKTGGRPLAEVDSITITKPEMRIIKGIKDKALERLAFTMLCIGKLNAAKNPKNKDGWINLDDKEIFEHARVKGENSKDRKIILSKLYKLKLIEMPLKVDKINYRCTFAQDGDPELTITDFRELGYQYNQHLGNHFDYCANCGVLIKQRRILDEKDKQFLQEMDIPVKDYIRYARKKNGKVFCKSCKEKQRYKIIRCTNCGRLIKTYYKSNNDQKCDICKQEEKN